MRHTILCSQVLLLTVSAIVVSGARRSRHRAGLRILYGRTDNEGEYPYVVALVSKFYRQCTGTLLSAEWVLTAAHCVRCDHCYTTHVQYGDMSLLPNSSNTKSEILQTIRHPGYRDYELLHDISLVRIQPVYMSRYGKLSAVDYHSLVGLAVQYAGYGITENNPDMDSDRRPLVIGEGVVRSCVDLFSDETLSAPYVCVAPKCSNNQGDSAPGDSGGPLFHDRKIVGVVSTGLEPIGFYASVSPYLTWISKIVNSPQDGSSIK